MHIKRAWPFSLHRFSEVFDYLCSPITTYKSTPKAERRRLVWRTSKKCRSFQKTR